jgi:tetratricopeptide (TPR) repeat protein
MIPPQKLALLKRNRDTSLDQARQQIARGRHEDAERLLKAALEEWRRQGAPKDEEGSLISQLGKALEGQRKYEEAYELYMQALNYLTGPSYDELYSQFLYLNQRMGTFDQKQDYGY